MNNSSCYAYRTTLLRKVANLKLVIQAALKGARDRILAMHWRDAQQFYNCTQRPTKDGEKHRCIAS